MGVYQKVTTEQGLRARSIPDRAYSILEADCGWMTAEQVHAEIVARFDPEVRFQSVRRALARLTDSGLVRTRMTFGVSLREYGEPPETSRWGGIGDLIGSRRGRSDYEIELVEYAVRSE